MVAASLLVILAISIWWAPRSTDPDPRPPASVLPGAARSFALLRTRPEGVPSAVQQALSGRLQGINWGQAQRLPTSAPPKVWVVPGAGRLCIVERQVRAAVAVSCASVDDVRRRGLATVMLRDGNRESPGLRVIAGIAPHGVRRVFIHTAGSRVSIPVDNGVFERRDHVQDPPDRLTLDRR